jgi:predicted metallopeptidase
MAARGNRPPTDRSFAQDAIIRETLERDPDYVLRLIAEIAERLKADGRYKPEEVEVAAMHLRRELGIGPSVN